MKLFHVTSKDSADKIDLTGFVDSVVMDSFLITDGTERYRKFLPQKLKGVWLADRPLFYIADEIILFDPVAWFINEIPDDIVTNYDWTRLVLQQHHREFFVPAEIVNKYPRLRCSNEEIKASKEWRSLIHDWQNPSA